MREFEEPGGKALYIGTSRNFGIACGEKPRNQTKPNREQRPRAKHNQRVSLDGGEKKKKKDSVGALPGRTQTSCGTGSDRTSVIGRGQGTESAFRNYFLLVSRKLQK